MQYFFQKLTCTDFGKRQAGFGFSSGPFLVTGIKPIDNALEFEGTNGVVVSQGWCVEQSLHRFVFPIVSPRQIIFHGLTAAVALQFLAISIKSLDAFPAALLTTALADDLP